MLYSEDALAFWTLENSFSDMWSSYSAVGLTLRFVKAVEIILVLHYEMWSDFQNQLSILLPTRTWEYIKISSLKCHRVY